MMLNIKDKPSWERMERLLKNLTEEQQRSIENYIRGYESGVQAGIRMGKALAEASTKSN